MWPIFLLALPRAGVVFDKAGSEAVGAGCGGPLWFKSYGGY